jgi:hypothetical protein
MNNPAQRRTDPTPISSRMVVIKLEKKWTSLARNVADGLLKLTPSVI